MCDKNALPEYLKSVDQSTFLFCAGHETQHLAEGSFEINPYAFLKQYFHQRNLDRRCMQTL